MISNNALQAIQLLCERSDRLLFSELSFIVNPGEMLTITGQNGSGKSSLLRILAGLNQPQLGQVLWNKQVITEQRVAYHQQLIYLGHSLNINGQLTVRENLRFMTALAGVSNEHIDRAIAEVGLSGFADEAAQCLSAGQKRRIALARLIAQPAQVWILDEPSTSLDKMTHAWLEQLLEQHLKDKGIVVIASHNLLTVQHAVVRNVELFGNGKFHVV